MDEAEKKRLETLGYWVGDYAEYLGLTEAERQHVELRISLSRAIRRLMESGGSTRRALARRIGSTPSQVAKAETGTVQVPLDLMFRVFFEIGGKLEDLTSREAEPKASAVAPIEPEAPATKPEPKKRLARSG